MKYKPTLYECPHCLTEFDADGVECLIKEINNYMDLFYKHRDYEDLEPDRTKSSLLYDLKHIWLTKIKAKTGMSALMETEIKEDETI